MLTLYIYISSTSEQFLKGCLMISSEFDKENDKKQIEMPKMILRPLLSIFSLWIFKCEISIQNIFVRIH